MLRPILQTFILAYLPGAVLFRLPGRSQAYRAGLPWEERLFWIVVLGISWSLAVVLGLAIVSRYTFQRLLIADVLLAAIVVLLLRGKLIYRSRAARPGWTALLPAGLILLGLWLYFPPSEYVIGGKDPGTYLNEGVQIAQRGQLVLRDETVAMVPGPFRDLFFPSHKQSTYYSTRFMGFFVQDPERGTVVGQFPHLFPASIAVGYGLNGLSGARQTVAVWTILGLVAIYFAFNEFLGQRVALAAAILCAINVITVWFARYPNSEVTMMALLFSSLLAFNRALHGGGTFFAVLAGSLLAGILFVRVEVVLAFVSVGGAALLAPVAGKRVGLGFWLSLAGVGLVGLWYLNGPMRAYAAYPLAFTHDHAALVITAVIVGILLLVWLWRWEPGRRQLQRIVPIGLAVGIVALAGYAYFLREPGGRTALGDAMAFRSFAWYLGPQVLFVATVGAAGLIATRFWRAPALLLTFAVVSVFFFYKMRIVPEHFWASRRFLAVSLPGAMMGLAVCADWAVGLRPVRAVTSALASRAAAGRGPSTHALLSASIASVLFLLLLGPVVWQFWRTSDPVRRHVEYAGLIPRLERLSAEIGERDLLLVESRDAGSDVHVLAVPLAYIYAKQVLVLNAVVPEREQMASFVDWAATRFDRVLFLGGGGSDLLSDRLTALPLAADRFQVPEYDARLNAYPSGVRRKEFEFGLYRLLTSVNQTPGPVRIDVGGLDDLNVVRFQARERSGDGTPFRWTRAQSWILLTGLSPDAQELTLWMSNGGRPAAAPAAVVEVALDDVVVGTAIPTDELRPYRFTLPHHSVAANGTIARVRLRVATWNPQTLLGAADSRDLGVMVSRVEAR